LLHLEPLISRVKDFNPWAFYVKELYLPFEAHTIYKGYALSLCSINGLGIKEGRKIFNFALILADYGKIKNLALAISKSFLNFTSTTFISTVSHNIFTENQNDKKIEKYYHYITVM